VRIIVTETEERKAPAGFVGIDYWRQLDMVPMDKLRETHVDLIGAGGIGSPTAMSLAKMGVGSLRVFDDDKVESHNLPNQLHVLNSLGMTKVDALTALLAQFVDDTTVLTPKAGRVDDMTALKGIVVSGVDSMKSRKAIWEATKMSPGVEHYIEARMGGYLLRVYYLNPQNRADRQKYEETLYDDSEALELPCTAQSLIYTGMMAAVFISDNLRQVVAGEKPDYEIVFDISTKTLLVS